MNAGSSSVSRPSARRRFLLAVGGAILLLASIELGVGTWARYARAPYESYDADRGTPTLVPGTHRTPTGVVEIDARGFVVGASRNTAPGTAGTERPFRIITLGDSCTFGAGDAESTYPAALEARLLRRPSERSVELPVRAYEVVNAGIAGLRSDEALGRLDYAISVIHPDVVTIYLGWNDLMKGSPRGQTQAAPFSPLWRAIDELWLVRGLRKLLFFHLRARFGTPRTGPEGGTGRFAGFRPSYFEANLRRLVAETRSAGARPLLVTLPHSLRRDLSPMDLLEPKRQYPYFYAGNALGDFVDLIERYNETIRRVGAAEGAPVAEVAGRFDRMTRKADYFFDTMHPNRRGNVLIAEVLERSLLEHGLLERPAGSARAGREE